MKKRIAAALLSACLALGPCAGRCVPAYGASKNAVQIKTEESTLKVEAVSTQQFPYEGKVTVELRSQSGIKKTQELEITKGGAETADFQVPEGDYTVTIQAEKFAGYTQAVHAEKGWTHKITVYSSRISNGSSAVPGWLRPGDVDGDGDIDEADSKALLEAVRAKQADAAYDLNSDGRVDLADLSFLVQSMDETQESSIEKFWVPDPAKAGTSEDTILADGTGFEAVFLEEGIVKLQNKSGMPISKDHPVEFTVTLAEDGAQLPVLGGMTIKAPDNADGNGSLSSQISDGTAQVVYMDENGKEQALSLPLDARQKQPGLAAVSSKKSSPSVSEESDGSLVLDFGGQIAVKRVTIRITGTKKTQKLAEIAKVSFINNMEERIPAPQLDIPSITSVAPGSKKLSVSWKAQKNITGYELYIFGPVKNQSQPESQIIAVSDTACEVSSINQKNLVNYKEYTLKVRSVNGDWKSPWSEAETAVPLPQGKPAPPDNVKAEGGYRSITVSWKDMDDANGYMVYYKEKNAAEYQPAVSGFTQNKEGTGRLSGTSCTINGLKEHMIYSVYVISWNEFGWSGRSLISETSTRSEAVPVLPAYKLLNKPNGAGQLTAHILDAAIGGSDGAHMVNSPLDTKKNSGFGLVDNDYASYWSKTDWEDGVKYPSASKGMSITLDEDYRINYFTFAAADQKAGLNTVRVEYWNHADAGEAKTVGARLLEKYDANDNPYYIVKLDETVTAYKIRMCIGRSYSQNAEMKVGEIRFYEYDPLEDEIMALYTDEMHMTLRNDVTLDTIQVLENRLHETDPASGEKHPLYQELALEIQTAKEILTTGLDDACEISPQITAQKDKHLGFGGLNDWQPLGKAACAGETLLVYVGHNTRRPGEDAQLQLVFTQYHAEASSAARTVSLKVGRNMITVPQLVDKNVERGGQIYAAYTGNSDSDKYAVRISGGSSIPVLNVYGKNGHERTQEIRAYVQKLETHAAALEQEHDSVHKGTKNVDTDYDPQNCILNATDILMEQMMYSLPATQVLAGIGNGRSQDEKVSQLDTALKSMEQMMDLFYQHKGLSSAAGTDRGNNALPSRHLNIRYMRMFAGAFMYAAGNHIGIEWGSTPLAGSAGSWNSFGWGIAHEIGHNINQSSYAAAEITNNYYAQLMKKIADGTTRFNYQKVYQKVTSGTVGRSSDVFTQLALYWQLYLAYSNDKNDGRIYDDYEEQFQNLFFARVDTYARNPQKAPQGGVTLGSSADQNLMRLACAAAQKNLLSFFERWGMVPDEITLDYAAKFPEETKAIYYVNDTARDYRISHKDTEAADTILGQDVVTARVEDAGSGRAAVTITAAKGKGQILGYEISRSMISNGEKETKPAGFVLIDETAASTVFTDNAGAVNNRVISYEVRAVDKFLNYSNAADAGSVKIQTDGMLDKSGWTVKTDMVSDDDKGITVDTENPDSGYDAENPDSVKEAKTDSIARIIDNERNAPQGIYQESAGAALETASITIDLHQTEAVTALKYQGSGASSLTVEISQDGQNWKAVKENDTGLKDAKESDVTMIWFDAVHETERENWIGTYDARYVRLKLQKSGPAVIREIDICGPSGDNLEFLTADSGKPAVGILETAYAYGSTEKDVIPAGSLVFTGTYKGNPAYNVIILYDADGKVIGTKDGNVHAEQVIFAPDPEHGSLGETSEGTWVYYVEPGQWDEAAIHSLKGVRGELYRVDDAKTMERERVVSDTQLIQIPQDLPSVTLAGSKN